MRTLLFVLLLAGFLFTFTVAVALGWPPGSPISPAVRGCGLLCGGLSLVLASWIAFATWGRKGRALRARRRNRSSAPGFTLTEMLAVLAIMLIAVSISFATLLVLAEQQGPESGSAVLQAATVSARALAVSSFHKTRLVIRSDWELGGSSVIELHEYAQKNPWEGQNNYEWMKAPVAFELNPETGQHERKAPYPARLLPAGVYAFKSVGATTLVTDEDSYKATCASLSAALWVPGSGSESPHFAEGTNECFVQFTPEGTVDWDSFGDEKAVNSQIILLTIAGGQVKDWSAYVINSNTGTRLVFE